MTVTEHAYDSTRRILPLLDEAAIDQALTFFVDLAEDESADDEIHISHYPSLSFQCGPYGIGLNECGEEPDFWVKTLLFVDTMDDAALREFAKTAVQLIVNR